MPRHTTFGRFRNVLVTERDAGMYRPRGVRSHDVPGHADRMHAHARRIWLDIFRMIRHDLRQRKDANMHTLILPKTSRLIVLSAYAPVVRVNRCPHCHEPLLPAVCPNKDCGQPITARSVADVELNPTGDQRIIVEESRDDLMEMVGAAKAAMATHNPSAAIHCREHNWNVVNGLWRQFFGMVELPEEVERE